MKISKKFLAIVLVVMLLFSAMPFASFAATANLSDILASAPADKYLAITDTDIVVDADTTLTGHILDLYGDVTIDLNGHNLIAGAAKSSGEYVAIWVNPGANVTITDSAQPSSPGYFSSSTGDFVVKAGVASISSTGYGIINEGNLTLGKVLIQADDNAVSTTTGSTLTTNNAYSMICGGTYGLTVFGATVNLEKGMVYGQYGISGNSSWDSANNCYKDGGNVINIGAAKIYGKGIDDENNGIINGAAMVLGADDDCTISGGATVSSYDAPAIVTRASASLNVTGSPSVTTYGTVSNVKVLNGSTTVPCAPVVVDTACGYTKADDIDVDIAGGTYKANIPNVENAVALVGNNGETLADYAEVTGGSYATTAGADDDVPIDTTNYVMDGNGKMYLKDEIGTIYKVEVTDANGKVTYSKTLTSLTAGSTYKLLADLSNGRICVGSATASGTATIDLNGHTLTSTVASGNSSSSIYFHNSASNCDLSIVNTAVAPAAFIATNDISVAKANCHVTIGENVTVNGSIAGNSAKDGTVIDIYGTVNGGNDVAIYQPQDGTLNIYDGATVTGATGIYAKAGTINVYGGTVEGTGDYAEFASNNSSAVADGSAIILDHKDNSTTYGDHLEANIMGGNIISANNKAVESEAGVAGQTPIDQVIPADSTAVFSSDVSDLAADGYATTYDAEQGGYVVAEAIPENGYNLTLEDGISINFIIDTATYGARGGYIHYEYVANTETETATRVTRAMDLGTTGKDVLTLKAAPAQIAEQYVIRIYNAQGELKDTLTASVAGYCQALKAFDASYTELADSILNYGQLANEYFGYYNLAGDGYEVPHTNDYDADLSSAEATQLASLGKAKTLATGNATVTGVSYIAKLNPEFAIYFSGTDSSDASLDCAVEGVTALAKPSVTTDGVVVKVSGLKSTDFAQLFTVTLDGTSYRLNGYGYLRMAMNSDNASLKALARGIFRYAVACDNAF